MLAKKIGEGILKILTPCGSDIYEGKHRVEKVKSQDLTGNGSPKTHLHVGNLCDPCRDRSPGCYPGQHSGGWGDIDRVICCFVWVRGKTFEILREFIC